MDDDDLRVITRVGLHDLRNRVATVKGLAQLLERQISTASPDDERLSRRITALRIEIDRLAEVVAGLIPSGHCPGDAPGDDFGSQ